METYITRYGSINGIGQFTLHENGSLMDCTLKDKVILTTPYGKLIPQFTYDYRKKNNYALSFYEDGSLRRISLNEATDITSPIGTIATELITFYDNGTIKRLFPLNGQLSAYWDEEDEYQLAKEMNFTFTFASISAKVIAISFYREGNIKDLTFWPKEKIKVQSPVGNLNVRTGLSIYPNGSLKSVEPAYPTKVNTPIGAIIAYDKNANGISGDVNSLRFTMDGKLSALITSGNQITVISNSKPVSVYTPLQMIDSDGLELSFQPLLVEFIEDTVIINKEFEFNIHTDKFIIEPYTTTALSICDDCESCRNKCDKGKIY